MASGAKVHAGGGVSFPQFEEEVLARWNATDAFRTSLKLSEGKPEYSFYDGPPFATGLPHYGHMIAGTIKDTITRYAHQTGHHVRRVFGWDCHGLPIEFEIEKQLKIKTREEILAFGIGNYNEECRKIVMTYSGEWEAIMSRLGRWIDFKNDYKTMDASFMESVWWVFRQLWEKGLVYRGFKVMPYSTACATPLSNFEAGMDYRDVPDPEAYVTFPLEGDADGASLMAWTTTPWTLPSNLAVVAHPTMQYVRVRENETNKVYIVLKDRVDAIWPPAAKGKEKAPARVTVLDTFPGEKLRGLRYVPLFDYFVSRKTGADGKLTPAFTVLVDDYVTSDTGTGIVHSAPAFGEDDYRVCMNAGVIVKGDELPCPIDWNGRYTAQIPEWQGVHVKEADRDILKKLKSMGRLFRSGTIVHSVPFCWRSDTPLIYRAVPSWFVKVESFRDKLVAANATTYWVPDFVKEKRFHNWLQNARDWAVSRSRFWGTPIPIWVNPEDETERVCVGSIEELERLSGVKGIVDLHRHHVDQITIPSPSGRGVLRRIEEVFDCFPAQDHQLLTNEGFVSLDEAERRMVVDPLTGRVVDARGLRFASFDAESQTLRYETPLHLVVKTRSSDEFVELSAKGVHDVVSLVSTRRHALYVRAACGEEMSEFRKMKAQDLLTSATVRVLSAAYGGVDPSSMMRANETVDEPRPKRARRADEAVSAAAYAGEMLSVFARLCLTRVQIPLFLELVGYVACAWHADDLGTSIFMRVSSEDWSWVRSQLLLCGWAEGADWMVRSKDVDDDALDSTVCVEMRKPEGRSMLGAGRALPEWTMELGKEGLNHVIRGLVRVCRGVSVSSTKEGALYVSRADVRESVVHLLLRAGYSVSFSSLKEDAIKTPSRWCISFGHPDTEPVVKAARATSGESSTKTSSWCVHMPSGFVVVRRVQRAASGEIVAAARATIQGNCWFESGSMPYAELHYPFENKELFEKRFPADFIAEGIDQTRGWFYTLLVLSTALMDGKPAFKNLIVNGMILAADGKKMSKRLRNYPNPVDVIHTHGADALRLYLISSPAVRADDLRFREAGVQDVVNDVLRPWYHAFRFLMEVLPASGFRADVERARAHANLMDRWILAASHGLLDFVQQEMAKYRLYTVVPRLLKFIDQLTNWYIRLNRDRLKGRTRPLSDEQREQDTHAARSTLFDVLLTVSVAMAPFAPFFSDYTYVRLAKVEASSALTALPVGERPPCVHFVDYPKPRADWMDAGMEAAVSWMIRIVELGRVCRDRRTLAVKTPVPELRVLLPTAEDVTRVTPLVPYIAAELNTRQVLLTADEAEYVRLTCSLDRKACGKRLGKDVNATASLVEKFGTEQVRALRAAGFVELALPSGAAVRIEAGEVAVTRSFSGDAKVYEACFSEALLVVLDTRVTDEMRAEGLVREVLNRVQRLRKLCGLSVGEAVDMYLCRTAADEKKPPVAIHKALAARTDVVTNTLRGARLWDGDRLAPRYPLSQAVQIARSTYELGGESFDLFFLRRPTLHFAESVPPVHQLALSLTCPVSVVESHDSLEMVVDGKKSVYARGKDWFASVEELAKSVGL